MVDEVEAKAAFAAQATIIGRDIERGFDFDDLVIFDAVRGMLVADDTVLMPLELKLLSKHDTYSLNVQVSATGRVKICNDSTATIKVPGFKQCS